MENSTITMFITLVSTSGVLTLFLCVYSFLKRKEIPGARTFIFYTAALVVYIFAVAFELASDSLEAIKMWTLVEYIGIGFAPPLGLLVVLNYIGKSMPRRAMPFLFVIPVITLFLLATNDYHQLFYKSIYFRGDAPVVDVEIGQWYIVQGCFTFGNMLAAFIFLLRQWRSTNKAFRPQLATFIIGQLLPMIGAFLYLMGVTPYGMDPVPMVLCVTSALYIWAMVQSHLLTLVPIAKESIFESMKEGVIVIDSAERIVDINDSVVRMIPGLTLQMIGRPLGDVWRALTGATLPASGDDGVHQEMNWTVKGAEATYQVRSSAVRGRAGDPVGRLLMLIDVTEQRRLQDKLTQQAYYDGLTKLLNRTRFIQRGRELLASARQFGQSVAVVLFDIDTFKRINDTYGHETGDRAILHVVDIVKRQLSPDALFARYGGEEFALALPGASSCEAAALAERARAALEAAPLSLEEGGSESIAVTASFGVAGAADGGDSAAYSLDALLREADAALYRAKREGRNRVRTAEGPASRVQ